MTTSDSTSGNTSKETCNSDSKEYMHSYAHCNIIYNSQGSKAAQVPIIRWVDEKAVLPLHNGILLSCKQKEILSFRTGWMDVEGIMLSEIS